MTSAGAPPTSARPTGGQVSRRQEALDAALALLGVGGSRGLTHGAVDRAGGLPPGTASNYFRTRDELLAGALDHLATREVALIRAFEAAHDAPATPEALVAETVEMVGHLLGPGRSQTMARHAIFLEAAWRPDLRDALVRATSSFWRLLEERLQRLGAPEPAASARTFLACIDGIILDQLIRPQPDFDAAAALRPVVTAVLDPRRDAAPRT
jgi:DNA-binding transcriptional regulator YbjK